MRDTFAGLAAAAFHWIPPLLLLFMAGYFGRSLRRGATPLIERIARHSNPELPPAQSRYTRRLTIVWFVYFIVAAVAAATNLASGVASLAVWACTVVLFVGEHRLRPFLFPGAVFPSLIQQFRDTWFVLHTKGR